LKTPLTALREGVSLLREEVPGPLLANQREVVEILQHNVIGLQQQIESLLSLNAATFEARRLRPTLVQLNSLLNEAVQRRELQIQARHLKIMIEATDEKIMLDAEKLSIVLDNLLSNAVDFSPEGGEIHLTAIHKDKSLHLTCIDQGPGVAEEDAQRIFDPFVQGRRVAPLPRKGSGVGLSIVRELVRAMGGRELLQQSQQGAHFCVEIPDEE
jgi:two-component system sensor histidine kinase GlrK